MPTKLKDLKDDKPSSIEDGSSDFDKIRDKNFSPGDEKMMEQRAQEGSDEDKQIAEGDDKLPISKSEKAKAGKRSSDSDDSKSMYKEFGDSGRFSGVIQKMGGNKWKRNAAVGGGATVAIITLIFGLFSFLNVFKLDGLMSNIDQRAFQRNNAAYDKMSSKMMRQYIILRLAENEIPGDPDGKNNLILRAQKVDNNNPLFDWYRTMRASKFEQELFDKKGIKFVSVMEQGKIRKAGIVFIKETADMDDETRARVETAIRDGDWKEINNGLRIFIDEKIFNSRADYRNALNGALHDISRDKNVFQRRHVRKAITNMLGYRDWRFFSDTRDKVDQKQLDMRNKIVSAMLPEKIKSGKLVRCLFGLDRCRGSVDAASSDNRADGLTIVDGKILPDAVDVVTTDPNNPDGIKNSTDYNKILTTILKKANLVVSLVDISSTLDMLASFHKQVSTLYKTVLIARGTQAMGLYQVMKTSRDQIKSGNVNPAELNEFMQVLDNAGGSEGWTKVVNGQGDSSKLTSSAKAKAYCEPQNQARLEKNPVAANKEFVYLCPEKQIGSASTAKSIQDSYDSSIGQVVGPIVGAWESISGGIFGKVLRTFSSILNKLVSSVTNLVLEALGVKDDLQKAMQWIFNEIAIFVGAGPILKDCPDEDKNGSKDCWDPAGVYFNWMMQGGSYTAESTSRHLGASASTPVTVASTIKDVDEYEADRFAQMSFFERTLAFDNPDSAGFKLSHTVVDNITSPRTALSKVPGIWSSLTSNLQGLFSNKAQADVTKAYRASSFSGIDTYDFPTHCYGRELIDTEPKYGTNIQAILSTINITVTDEELTWDLVTNNNLFYDFLYEKIGDYNIDNLDLPQADDIAVQVYNCNLLDNAVRGSIGYVYGFTKDYGLEDTQPSNGEVLTPTTPAGSGIVGDIGLSSSSVDCAVGTNDIGVVQSKYTGTIKKESGPLMIRLCQIPDLPGQGNNITGKEVGGGAIVNSRVSGAWLALAKAAKAASIGLSSNSSFRLADSCGGTGNGGACATPGGSPHQLGVAIDFAGMNGIDPNAQTCSVRLRDLSSASWKWMYKNAEKFGFEQYSAESWHWDPIPAPNRCNSSEPAGIV